VAEGERGPVKWTCCWLAAVGEAGATGAVTDRCGLNSKTSTAPGGCGLAGQGGLGPGRYLKFSIRIC
jgi:hypothetical protein